MSNNEKKTKKSTEVIPRAAPGNLISSDEFDSFFDDFLTRRWPRLFDWGLPAFPADLEKSFPKVDILDHENDIEVQAALPGFGKDDLDVSIDSQRITIRASAREEKKTEGRYFRREIRRGEFQRTLILPENVD
ncbi:MAG: Hsp20/alpha crystallin family protein [Gammaproteobacteria bacterium]